MYRSWNEKWSTKQLAHGKVGMKRTETTLLLTLCIAPYKINNCKAKGIKMGFVLSVFSCDAPHTAKSLLWITRDNEVVRYTLTTNAKC